MSWAIWITGPPGSGKSTLARAAAARLAQEGRAVTVLELDAMRRIVTPVPTYGDAERDAVYRALVWVAATLVEAGVPVLVDATGHRRTWRDLARALIGPFAEVQLAGPPPAAEARAGVEVEYEPAEDPEVRLDTGTTSIPEAVARVVTLAHGLPAPPPREPRGAWAIWITGPPGSGKTTIASHVAEALAGSGVTVRILEAGELLAFVAGGCVTPLADAVAHRALVYAAKLLSDAGVAVLLDATAPVRVWRETARALIPRFAEVQLACPAHVCATRERAVRWRLIGCPHAPPRGRAATPDVACVYEAPLCPELILYTDVEGPWSSAAAVVALARRLHAASAEGLWTVSADR